MRRYPAQTTQSGVHAATASASSASKASRDAWSLASRLQRRLWSTRCKAAASGRSENTPTTSPSSVPAAIASSSACRLEPRPETSTAMRFIERASGRICRPPRSSGASSQWPHRDVLHQPMRTRSSPAGLDHLADGAMGEAEAAEVGADRSDVTRCDHQHEADAAIERAPHFIVRRPRLRAAASRTPAATRSPKPRCRGRGRRGSRG